MKRLGWIGIVSVAVCAWMAGCSGGGDYECIYDTDCSGGQVCRNGACVGPCEGLICEDPPGDASCYEIPGECRFGNCSYTPLADGTDCESEDPCTVNGVCHQGICAGEPLVCNTPPAATCTDGTTLRTYTSSGRCVDGDCVYDHAEVTCSQGCADGRCVGDPCAGVTCDSPPEPAVCYVEPGTCSSGECSYDYNDGHICDDGDPCRVQDSCRQGVCAGVPMQCTSPPANECDGSTAVIYDSRGTCSGGQCEYGSQRVECAEGCEGGQCLGDPCQGVNCSNPPNAQCYEPTGICVEEPDVHCEYTQLEDETGCDDGNDCTVGDVCTDGDCGGAPMQCNSPPDNYCQDGSTLVSYAGNGTCSGGQCSYNSSEQHCDFGCVERAGDDVCDGDPCAGVTCNNPPAPDCANATTRRWYDGGTCVSGQCEYDAHTETCDDPPADRCESGDARHYNAIGGCSNGECSYGSYLETCEHGCSNGICGDCVPASCGANNCGSMPDGCGGTVNCGGCSDPQDDCESNVCVCNHAECSGDCCAAGQVCHSGACCTPSCAGKCGGASDGCGGQCSAACPSGQWCNGTTCQACNDAHHCGSSCTDCGTDGWWCQSGACQACTSNTHCGPDCEDCTSAGVEGSFCDFMPVRGGADGYFCGCNDDSECFSGRYCGPRGCRNCTVGTHCGPSCIDCSSNNDGHACVDGMCGCNSTTDCPSGRTCNTSSHLCVASTETNCADGVDNDNDGDTDCEDANCDGRPCDWSAAYGAACYSYQCRDCDTFGCLHSKDPKAPPDCPTGCPVCTTGDHCMGIVK
ncbi:MAG: hypothetical protein JXR96_22300 [Deltaproteobacteria bacterium]|nr:hypothetical protein [Deltaproteobacteria bacterium]